MQNVPWRLRDAQHGSPPDRVLAAQRPKIADLLGVAVLLAPAVYGTRWVPLVRLSCLWVMAVIVIILVRLPLIDVVVVPDWIAALGL